jgi:hypothetical protein
MEFHVYAVVDESTDYEHKRIGKRDVAEILFQLTLSGSGKLGQHVQRTLLIQARPVIHIVH